MKVAALLSILLLAGCATPETFSVREDFGPGFDAKKFLTPLPNKNTSVRDGVLWTRGSSGGKYPPMVYLALDGKDLTMSFRYRHLEKGGMLWLFVDGDDGYGSVDHMLRVRLNRDSVVLEVDAHTLDPKHPLRQNTRAPDPVSKAYRTNEHFPAEKVDLSANDWRTVKLVFKGDTVDMSVDGKWTRTLQRPNFDATKRKLLWMQNGGAAVLHPEQLALGRVEVRSLERAGPLAVDGHVHGVSLEDEFHGAPIVGGEIDLLGREVFVGAVSLADRIGRAGVLAQRVLGVEGVGIDFEHDAVAVEADTEHVVDRAVAVVAVDEEPEHAAFLEVAVTEGHRQVLTVQRQVDHRRVFSAAGSARPEDAVAHRRILVRERRQEFLRIKARSEVLADRESLRRGATGQQQDGKERRDLHLTAFSFAKRNSVGVACLGLASPR